eukprot:173432_1
MVNVPVVYKAARLNPWVSHVASAIVSVCVFVSSILSIIDNMRTTSSKHPSLLCRKTVFFDCFFILFALHILFWEFVRPPSVSEYIRFYDTYLGRGLWFLYLGSAFFHRTDIYRYVTVFDSAMSLIILIIGFGFVVLGSPFFDVGDLSGEGDEFYCQDGSQKSEDTFPAVGNVDNIMVPTTHAASPDCGAKTV